MEKMKSKKSIIAVLAALIVLAGAFVGVYFLAIEQPVSGDKTITVEIVHSDKTVKTVEITTNAEFLRQALEEKKLVQGTESAYGLFINTVDGETADWDNQQQYWCLTKNGEYLNDGVDTIVIKDGDKFEITLTVG
jgi:hypothetical protein